MKQQKHSTLGEELIEAMQDALAWKRNELRLEERVVEAMPAEQVKAIRRKVAKSTRDFEKRFLIPSRTIEGWEQGRRIPDVSARILLTIIDRNPQAVEDALRG